MDTDKTENIFTPAPGGLILQARAITSYPDNPEGQRAFMEIRSKLLTKMQKIGIGSPVGEFGSLNAERIRLESDGEILMSKVDPDRGRLLIEKAEYIRNKLKYLKEESKQLKVELIRLKELDNEINDRTNLAV